MTGDDWTGGVDALVLSGCRRCGRRWYLPHDRCPHCGGADHRRLVSTGIGTVAAATVVRSGTDEPFGLCLVDLDEGVRVMGRSAITVRVGDRVGATWVGHRPVFLAVSDPAGSPDG